MSSLRFNDNHAFDQYFGRWIKNWVHRFVVPADGRSRLMKAAVGQAIQNNQRSWYTLRPVAFTVDELPDLYSTLVVHAIEGYWRNRTLPAHSI